MEFTVVFLSPSKLEEQCGSWKGLMSEILILGDLRAIKRGSVRQQDPEKACAVLGRSEQHKAQEVQQF